MNKTKLLLITVLAVMAGLLGGAASTQLFIPEGALAQTQKVVKADSFVLVDDNGKVRANLYVAASGHTLLNLMNKYGRSGIRLWVHPNGANGIQFFAGDGDEVASLPNQESRGSVQPVKKIRIGTSGGGKEDRPAVGVSDLDAIVTQMNYLIETVDKLTALH